MTRRSHLAVLTLLFMGMVLSVCRPAPQGTGAPTSPTSQPSAGHELATLAGGCFWCMEPPFEGRPGVVSVISGYTGGPEKGPTYKQVSGGRTGHTEAVQVTFDPEIISYEELLEVFWRSMDPTDAGGQFADRGSQYRPGIFVHDARQREIAVASKKALADSNRFEKPIAVEITEFDAFYAAEEYHQDYYLKNPSHYKRYRVGSGRTGFLVRVWGEEPIPKKASKHQATSRPTGAPKTGRYTKPPHAELRKKLTDLQFRVTQENGTERPFRNEFWDHKRAGLYVDIVSGEPLFSSVDKFESGTGWPSFVRPAIPENVVSVTDNSLWPPRVEVRSKHGDSHLGHVFDDGPRPTGLRYCINSASLRFIPVEELEKAGYPEFVGKIK